MNLSTGGSLKPPTALIVSAPSRFAVSAAEVADEVADLLLAEEEPLDVLGLRLQRGLVDVDDRELHVREALRGGGDRVALREADADDEVVALADEAGHVRHVVGRRARLDHAPWIAQLTLGPLQALVRELVEPVVVELAQVGDEADLQRRRGRRLGRRTGFVVVATAACREQRHGGKEPEREQQLSSHCGSFR